MLPVLPPRTEGWAVAQGQYWWSLGISCVPVTGSVGLVEAGRESCDSSCDTTSAAALSEVDAKSIRAVISNRRACPKFLACYWNVLGFHCMWWNGEVFFHLGLLPCECKIPANACRRCDRGWQESVVPGVLFQLKDALESCTLAKASSPVNIWH